MTTEPRTDPHVESTSIRTESVVHDFVRDAVLQASKELTQSDRELMDHIQFECGPDGDFRQKKRRILTMWPTLSRERLHILPGHQACVECLKSDSVIGPHLDRLVGTRMSSSRIDADRILTSLIRAMLDDEGRLTFTEGKFDHNWR
jgi:hypothetical protein